MYAVFKTGGKQYRAEKGDKLKIEKLDAAEGDSVEFDEVLLVGEGSGVKVGTPLVAGGKEGKLKRGNRTFDRHFSDIDHQVTTCERVQGLRQSQGTVRGIEAVDAFAPLFRQAIHFIDHRAATQCGLTKV